MRGGAWFGALAGCLLLSVLASAAPAAGDDLAGTRQRLAEIEHRIEQKAATAKAQRRREADLRHDLTDLEREQKQLEHRIADLEERLKKLSGRRQQEEAAAAALKTSVASLGKQVRRRLVALYKTGDGGLMRVLFSAASPARIAEDYSYFARIIGHDRKLIADYQDQLQRQQQSLQRLAELHRRQEATLTARRRERQTLHAAGALKTRLLAALKVEQGRTARELAELKERAERLAALVKRLESAKGPEYTEKPGLFEAQKGHLPWPLAGPVEVTFGTGRHPELGTLHDSQGIEIGCAPGTAVRAVWSGRVIFANWFKGYGNLLILDHGDSYYSLYAQAASLARRVGEQVAAGEVVATSGYEGTRRLYFEIRHSGTPLDPQEWLAAQGRP